MTASSGLMRLQNGWGPLGSRGYSHPGAWTLRDIVSAGDSFAEISITTPSGVLVGKIRSDCQNSIISQIEFTIDEHGCSSFTLKLNALPPFPMFPFSVIQIKVGNTRYNWYSGEISYKDDEGISNEDGYEFTGVGLRNYLSTLKAKTTYAAGLDVGAIIKDLIQTWVVPYCPIKYNESKVMTTTGVITANAIELSSMPIETILNTLAPMAGCDWGVDGDKDMYFLHQDDAIQKTLFVGHSVNSFKPKWNLSEVKNVITVQRQEGAGSGGVGWAVAGIYNDASSVRKYGRKELNYQIPGYFHDEEADIIGNALLSEKKEPAMSATVSGFLVSGGNDFLSRGNYRFIMPFGVYYHTYDDIDDATLWTAGADVAITKDMTTYVYGDGAIKIEYNGASYTPNADLATITKTFDLGTIKNFNFYIRSNVSGSFLRMDVFDDTTNAVTLNIDIPVKDRFINVKCDVSGSGLKNISAITLYSVSAISAGTEIFIDRIELGVSHHKPYELRLTKSKYKFSPTDHSATAEFGKIPPKMENYLSGLFATATELKFAQEILYDTGGGGGGGVTPSTKFVEGPDLPVVDGNILIWDGTTGEKAKDSGSKPSDFGDHTKLTNNGTNTHSQIDAFITSKAAASGLASLDGSSKVVQDPANATATPTASKIPIADGTGKLAAGWIPTGAATYFKETKCVLSNAADTENDITFGACSVLSSDGSKLLTLSSAMTKKTDADFAAGTDQGGGNLGSSAWYHVYLIRKDSDGTIDAYFDTDGAAANKPAGYTYYRHVGWIYHSTSTGVTQFFQVGNRFYLKTKVRSIVKQNPGTNAVLAEVQCPPEMIAMFTFILQDSSATESYALVTSPSQTDSTPSSSLFDIYAVSGDGLRESARFETLTDSSSRIRYRVSYSASTVWVLATSDGWIDTLL